MKKRITFKEAQYNLRMNREERIRGWCCRVKQIFEEVDRDYYDYLLELARQDPHPIGIALPSPEETAWMTYEERQCVEWFDRHDYDMFMKRSAWYEGDGWIIPYLRIVCEMNDWVSYEVLNSFSNDVADIWDNPPTRQSAICHFRRMSWSERFLRVADKLFEAAKNGNARAQNEIGLFCETRSPRCVLPFLEKHFHYPMHIFDNFVDDKARCSVVREWFRKSAEGGDIQGQKNYAKALVWGYGVKSEVLDRSEWQRSESDLASQRLGVEYYRKVAERGDVEIQYRLAWTFVEGYAIERNVKECAKWTRLAARNGWPQAMKVLEAVSGDFSDERICTELLISGWGGFPVKLVEDDWGPQYSLEGKPDKDEEPINFGLNGPVDLSDIPSSDEEQDKVSKELRKDESHSNEWLLKDMPKGSEVPPASGRETVRTPNLKAANPSFAAQLIIYVRDRFGGDAPRVYRAAQVSRKTYSAIISNELRPVSKEVAILFALALELSWEETGTFLRTAGYALSYSTRKDLVVRSCIISGIHDLKKVNKILKEHGVKPLGNTQYDDDEPF